ncbi:uncharacterized protein BDZ99DRAFT_514329 [Mytilinidion resinicola]|uniref:Uncharacterized protein n=1 Tax=Mytilinidion resinicola TaxID=574789 RepID=A0A6A6Z5Z2_9PEZI|nr:uncharacterized protein BDZ99DRAFT_514329 [Mytilinidion resinicola]KAF2815677.1 hypothetical protein BDZ99DRAFT_514329 [Mytilinidion resinicola]
MQDSPLSITASITGILTFIAAICAFVYVRYNTLRSGQEEILTILESVTATVEESRAIAHGGLAGDDPDSSRLTRLVSELYSIELAILAQCMTVFGMDLDQMQLGSRPSESTSTTWKDVVKEVNEAQQRWQQPQRRKTWGLRKIEKHIKPMIEFIDSRPILSIGWAITISVLSLGATPTMIRWYGARKKVLEKIQQREIIRSRLLFHQIALANSIASSQEILVRGLVQENVKLESRLSQLNDIAMYTNESIRRLAHDNNEIKGLIVSLISPASQQDRTQKPDTVRSRSSSGSSSDSNPTKKPSKIRKRTVRSRSSSGSSSDSSSANQHNKIRKRTVRPGSSSESSSDEADVLAPGEGRDMLVDQAEAKPE